MFNPLFLKIVWFYLNIPFSIFDNQNDKKNKEENTVRQKCTLGKLIQLEITTWRKTRTNSYLNIPLRIAYLECYNL